MKLLDYKNFKSEPISAVQNLWIIHKNRCKKAWKINTKKFNFVGILNPTSSA